MVEVCGARGCGGSRAVAVVVVGVAASAHRMMMVMVMVMMMMHPGKPLQVKHLNQPVESLGGKGRWGGAERQETIFVVFLSSGILGQGSVRSGGGSGG